jgi:hypothetical protein
MSIKKIVPNLSIASATLTAAIALTSQPAVANKTTFQCIGAGGGYATIAVSASGKKTEPLITWNSAAFEGSGWTPQRRCDEVTSRLNSVVTEVGGLFSSVLLTTGVVNGYDVICWVNNEQSRCNSNNLLVTISPGRDPGQFLANLLNRRANPYQQGTPGQENIPRTVVRFGQMVEEMLEEGETEPIQGHDDDMI